MKKVLTFALILSTFIAFSQVNVEKLDSKNGFKDLNFGKTTSELSQYISDNPVKEIESEKTKIYKVTDESFHEVANYKIESIEAHFYDDHLYMIRMYIDGAYNSGGLLRTLQKAYGKGDIKNATNKKVVWLGKKVHLSYDERSYSQNTEVIFLNEPLSKERKDYINNYGVDDL